MWVFIEAGLINADNSSNISLGNKKGSVPVGVSNSVSEQNIYLKVSQWDSYLIFSLSKPDTIEFAKTLWVFIEAGLINADNSSNISLGNKKGSVPVGVSNSVSEQNIYLKVSQWDSYLRSDHKPAAEDRVFEKIHRALSNPEGKMLPDPHKALENIHHKNVNRLIFTQLNVKSLRLILFIT